MTVTKEQIDGIRKSREHYKACGGDETPSQWAIDDLLEYIRVIESKANQVSTPKVNLLLCEMCGTTMEQDEYELIEAEEEH